MQGVGDFGSLGAEEPCGSLLFLEHLLEEEAGVEGGEIFEFLASADETGGDVELVLDGYHDAAFAAAVELGDDDAGEVYGLVKFPGLLQGV